MLKIRSEEAFNTMLESYEEAIESAKNIFETVVDVTIQKLKDSIGAFGLDSMIQSYNRSKEIQDFYLSNLEKTY
jgi:hypothetical protein